ncbi:MAG: phosphoribosylglycinamide formyltransferase [Corynebacterium sp.]|uniref:phosphoribosylglycinamide formyltransferase n=1 Tax=Corynebacterium sp. TaxID=1720 RepID=UPI0026DB5A53|nr:phosphoribosylglycinamide formyltransferase [Corynebacterium sp.]MDO5030158.1 phosphoribosylglycinamide formyltransferase [Corynebacterium sp.]
MTEAQPVADFPHNNSANQQIRIVVLASGVGSLLQSMLELLDKDKVQIVAVGSDKDCPALERAQKLSIPTFQVSFDEEAKKDRQGWDARVLEAVNSFSPDIVVSAGFMRILGPSFVDAYKNRIINTHPALLPSFPGAHAVPDALDYGVKVTGTTVHIVDNGVDTGPILAQQPVAVEDDDTVETLHERIKVVERRLLVDVLHSIADHGIERDGRKAYLK